MSFLIGIPDGLIKRGFILAVTAAVFAGLGAPSQADVRSFDLRTASSLTLLPDAGFELYVSAIVPAGDFNGDGEGDILVASCGIDDFTGVSFVLLGPLPKGRVELGQVGASGVRIDGASEGDHACRLSPAGDVNGDGLDDIVVGADQSAQFRGTAYVIFGTTSKEPIDLADFDEERRGGRGFRIVGGENGLVGHDVDSLGDVNGDGLDDLVLGAFGDSAYVVFGKSDPAPIDLYEFDQGVQTMKGWRIDVPAPDFNSGYSVGGAGDVNGDGVPDVIVGNIRREQRSAGSAYVVFGKSDPLPVDVTTSPGRSFRIKGIERRDGVGRSVSGAGDVNGDGLDDVIVGGPQDLRDKPGSAWLVFGKKDTNDVLLASLGDQGYEIRGNQERRLAGWDVDRLGDVNGDGLDDVLLSVPGSDSHGRLGAGSVYIIYGKKGSSKVRLGRLGDRGVRFYGERKEDGVGWTVGSAGDLESDGILDIVAGTSGPGKGYVFPAKP